MRKTITNLFINATSLVMLSSLASTGFLLKYCLSSGRGGGRHAYGLGREIWGLGRRQWSEIHLGLSFILLALITVHLIYHWPWICAMLRVQNGKADALRRYIMGSSVVISLVLLIMPLLYLPTPNPRAFPGVTNQASDRQVSPEGQGTANVLWLTGVLTMGEVVQRTGLSPEEVRTALGLKRQFQASEKLGRILQTEGIQMVEARRRLSNQRGARGSS